MNEYTVVLPPDALEQLAEAWLRASDRDAVTAASREIEMTLRTSPQDAGMELSEGLRVIEIDPLCVLYSIAELDRIVQMESVRLIEFD